MTKVITLVYSIKSLVLDGLRNRSKILSDELTQILKHTAIGTIYNLNVIKKILAT